MAGSLVDFECGAERFAGYHARPAAGHGPAVVVLQEWWGLVGHIKSVVDRFAQAGFNAMAPDLYKGDSTTEPDEAGSLMMALDMAQTERMLACAVNYLLADPGTQGSRAGVVGFCMGGQLSLFAASANPKIGACVDFYGIHPKVEPRLEGLSGPVLGFFAEHDAYASPAAVAELSRRLTAAGKRHEFKTYAGCNHAFFNDDRPQVYDAAAAQDAWERMLSFLRTELG